MKFCVCDVNNNSYVLAKNAPKIIKKHHTPQVIPSLPLTANVTVIQHPRPIFLPFYRLVSH